MPQSKEPPASIALPAQRLTLAGACTLAPTTAEVAVETPVNIVYGTVPYAVMMASPVDLADFVTGFSLTEGVIAEASDIRTIDIRAEDGGMVVEVTLVPARLRSHLAHTRRRTLTGRTSCGLCGIETMADLPFAEQRVRSGILVRPEAIARALGDLRQHQALHCLTRAVHAAAWCDAEGQIVTVREDVGRHNALDKLIGARMRIGGPREGFVLVTSRASFEMVEKTAIFGAPALVAISAPTSLAIDRANCLGLTLVATARDGAAMVFAGQIAVGQKETAP